MSIITNKILKTEFVCLSALLSTRTFFLMIYGGLMIKT